METVALAIEPSFRQLREHPEFHKLAVAAGAIEH